MSPPSLITPTRAALILAFAIVYLIWGSTYLAIRYAVESFPPMLMVGMRFSLAGAIMYAFCRLRGTPAPTRIHWRAAAIIGVLMVSSNVGVTWSETVVSSGMAAMLVTTVPLWMVLVNWLRPGGVRPHWIEGLGIALGFSGVVLLVGPRGGESVHLGGAAVLIAASLSWSIGSIYSRHAPLPQSPFLSTGMEMLSGGCLVLIAGTLLGDWSRFDVSAVTLKSWLSLGYLLVFGSIVGFTAFVWLLRVTTPAKVATYAYVNPVVAVVLGAMIAGETITARSLTASAIVIGAVIIITTRLEFLVGLFYKGSSRRVTPAMLQEAEPTRLSMDHLVDEPISEPHVEGRFTLAQLMRERSALGSPYLEFLRSGSMSLGLYVLPAGSVDLQRPHSEDEAYYVVEGRGRFRLGVEDVPVEAGTVLFVHAGVDHRFYDIEETLTILVFFAPAECSLRPRADELAATSC